ncbi:MAG: polysaccharide deacetylase family protein [Oscillospiraceae bacterium]|nr:polysaccharide deacetylase family protein [Oscillospiraceae bacterium]
MKRFFFLPLTFILFLSSCTLPVGSGSVLSNETKGWGFRKMQPRPEVTAEQAAEMEKYGCYYMGSEAEKTLYLTFDEGYENGHTAQILDVLKEKQVPAAFFVTGPYLKTEGELVKRMLDEGHIVGNHSINHPSLPELSDEGIEAELYGLDLMLYEGYGVHMKYLRPPRGEYSSAVLEKTKNMGYTSVFWSVAYVDWKTDSQQGAAHAVDSVVPQLHSGAVILLHAVSADNAAAMGSIIDKARELGYEFKSLDEYK